MNRQQAMKYDEELQKELQNCAREYSEDTSMTKYIVDNFVEFIPKDDVKGMIFLGNNSASYKAGNVRLDFRKALLAGVEFVASISNPESIFNYIQLLIVSVLFIGNITKLELGRLEAYVIYLLHTKGAYQSGVEEEQFILEVQEWYQQKEGKELEHGAVVEAIHHLYDIKAVDFSVGRINLVEQVWGKLA